MDLTFKDLQALIDLEEKQIRRMLEQGVIPAYRIGDEVRFNRAEIKAWCLERNIPLTRKAVNAAMTDSGISLTALIGRGGCFREVPGKNAVTVIKNAVGYLSLPLGITREELTFNLLEREEMMTTAIGRGIALPHPRQPLITDPLNQMVALCFLKKPIDFQALDREPVHTLFVVLSADAPRHLEILSRLSFLCRDDRFVGFLEKRVAIDEILDYIMLQEIEWGEKADASSR